MTSISKAPGKIILFGEHFVVHGNRAILGAIDKYATVTSEKTNTNNILISSSLGQASIEKDENVSNVEKKFRPFFYIAKEIISKYNEIYQNRYKNSWFSVFIHLWFGFIVDFGLHKHVTGRRNGTKNSRIYRVA